MALHTGGQVSSPVLLVGDWPSRAGFDDDDDDKDRGLSSPGCGVVGCGEVDGAAGVAEGGGAAALEARGSVAKRGNAGGAAKSGCRAAPVF